MDVKKAINPRANDLSLSTDTDIIANHIYKVETDIPPLPISPRQATTNYAGRQSTLIDAALQYAHQGLKVFPLRTREKIPATKNGFYDATLEASTLQQWWFKNPSYNVAITTGGGFFVVDADDLKAMKNLIANNAGDWPCCPTVKTGQGEHYYFAVPEGIEIKNRTGLIPGIDIRGAGGYIVAPPSIHPSGIQYEFIEPLTFPLPSPPQWLVKLITTKHHDQQPQTRQSSRYGERALSDACGTIASALNGQRNDILNSQSYCIAQLVAGGELNESDARQRLQSAGAAAGLTTNEITTTLNSAFSSGFSTPRTAPKPARESIPTNSINRYDTSLKPIPLPNELPPVKAYDDELLPDALRDAVRDIAERQQCPPEFVAVTAICGLAGILGRKVCIKPKQSDNWSITPTQWGVIVGRPSAMKSPAMKAALEPVVSAGPNPQIFAAE